MPPQIAAPPPPAATAAPPLRRPPPAAPRAAGAPRAHPLGLPRRRIGRPGIRACRVRRPRAGQPGEALMIELSALPAPATTGVISGLAGYAAPDPSRRPGPAAAGHD